MKKRKKAKPRRKDLRERKIQEWRFNHDFIAVDEIVKEYGVDVCDIPERDDIQMRAETHRHDQRALDVDAGSWVYWRLLEAERVNDMAALIREAYAQRVDTIRLYTTKAPFSALLIAHFRYDKDRAAKIGVYLRAALHQRWSVPKLRKEMKARWYIKPSAVDAQKYLQEQGEIKKRKKPTSLLGNSAAAGGGGSGIQSNAALTANNAQTYDDDDFVFDNDDIEATKAADDDIPLSYADGEQDDGGKIEAVQIRLTVPAKFVEHLNTGKPIFPELVKAAKGEIVPIRWHLDCEFQQHFGQSSQLRQKGRSSYRRDLPGRLQEMVEELRERVHGKDC